MLINYHDLEIYHIAHEFVLETYKLVKSFPNSEDQNLTSQLCRAATSLPLNIAESTGRRSNKLFLNFLTFSYGSALEIEAALALTLDLGYITKEQHEKHHELLDKFIRKLYKYMQYIESKLEDNRKDKTSWYLHEKWNAEQDMKKREGLGKLA